MQPQPQMDDIKSADEQTEISWLGLQAGDFKIVEVIGEGSFSTIYLGLNEATAEKKVFKVAKSKYQQSNTHVLKTMCFPTQALIQITGAFANAKPCPTELLKKQAEKLLATDNNNLVKISNCMTAGTVTFYECEYLQGKTLSELMAGQEVDLSFLVRLADILDKLHKDANFGHHGDLKPDNIIVTEGGIKLIDPGFFGNINTGHRSEAVAVTTPGYYPLLEPDDMFAFGVIAWQILTGQHPLVTTRTSADVTDKSRIDETLFETIKMREMVGNYFSSGLLFLQHPSQINPGINTHLGNVLLKLLRVNFNNSVLCAEPGYRTFGDIAAALLPHV